MKWQGNVISWKSAMPRRTLNMTISSVSHFIHRNLLWLLLASYIFAGFAPGPGLAIKNCAFGHVSVLGQHTTVSLPMLMLGLLLLNAGLGVETAAIRNLLRSAPVLFVGLAANVLVPVGFIFGLALSMRYWHNPDEVQYILAGLALVAAMPIAGSSTAWSQNANGNLALSLGLVLFSTLLSPLTSPVALHSVGFMASGGYAAELHGLAAGSTGIFLGIAVIVPSLIGILVRATLGQAPISPAKPVLKLLNSMNLLLLNYSNASISLPQAVTDRDWDFLAVLLAIVVGLCVSAFGSGWLIARLLRVNESQRTALMFGLGMNNNGTGLVLASMTLAAHHQVLLPIIFYNLVQHLVAGSVDFLLSRSAMAKKAP